MADMDRGTLGALLLGFVTGGVLAILYAPDKGEKTRERLAKKSNVWGEKASDAFETAGEVVEKSRKRFGI
jgi:gas vesicle protein